MTLGILVITCGSFSSTAVRSRLGSDIYLADVNVEKCWVDVPTLDLEKCWVDVPTQDLGLGCFFSLLKSVLKSNMKHWSQTLRLSLGSSSELKAAHYAVSVVDRSFLWEECVFGLTMEVC